MRAGGEALVIGGALAGAARTDAHNAREAATFGVLMLRLSRSHGAMVGHIEGGSPFIADCVRNRHLFIILRGTPMKKQVPHDKYFLRSLHQEIDLYDRKLAYLDKYVQFASIDDRKEAEGRLLSKRSSLAETAKQLVAAGVEFNPADLPRSFRTSAETAAGH